ncbi:MAG: C45 family autoproteolytic acyltransferase/hydrolase [Planctomycetota bacterium]
MAKARRWLRRLLLFLGGTALVFSALVAWAVLYCFAEPPELDYEPGIYAAPAPSRDGPRMRYGPCWFEERPGHSLLYLEGDPYSIGYANATLTRGFLHAQEKALFDTIRHHVPGKLKLYSIALVVLLNNRNLPDYVPLEYQEEILGLSDASPDPYPEWGPRYHRILNYHAAHDIGHWVYDRPVMGCTAFAVAGKHAIDGNLMIGRNFDFEAGREFDTNKVIGCYRPAAGNAFLSVAWAGMAGALTGLNDKRIYCSLNGAHSEDRNNIGTPVSIVVRQVLQYASTLDEAIELISKADVFVSDSYLVADGKTGEAAVVEKSPGRVGVRRMQGQPLLQANHFETEEFADDTGNAEYERVGTSMRRRTRLAELLAEPRPLDVAAAVAILRDRRGKGGADRALGNRGTINPCIATHSVVCDVTRGLLWVSRGPHQLGAYDAYSIERFGDEVAPPVAASPVLADYDKLTEARTLIGQGGRKNLERALVLNPGDVEALRALAIELEAAGETEAALQRYREALAAGPPFADWNAEFEAAIARLGR